MKGLGFGLIQQREGFGVGQMVAHRNKVVKGTKEALVGELKEAFASVQGKEGEEKRRKLNEMGDEIRRLRQGAWRENVMKFGRYGREMNRTMKD